jgi:hypothetical protein
MGTRSRPRHRLGIPSLHLGYVSDPIGVTPIACSRPVLGWQCRIVLLSASPHCMLSTSSSCSLSIAALSVGVVVFGCRFLIAVATHGFADLRAALFLRGGKPSRSIVHCIWTSYSGTGGLRFHVSCVCHRRLAIGPCLADLVVRKKLCGITASPRTGREAPVSL